MKKYLTFLIVAAFLSFSTHAMSKKPGISSGEIHKNDPYEMGSWPCKEDSECQKMDCKSHDTNLKSPHKAMCVEIKTGSPEKMCKCMCPGCE